MDSNELITTITSKCTISIVMSSNELITNHNLQTYYNELITNHNLQTYYHYYILLHIYCFMVVTDRDAFAAHQFLFLQ
jgi:hypothetical protein